MENMKIFCSESHHNNVVAMLLYLVASVECRWLVGVDKIE